MVSVFDLWLPILLSAVFVFIASSVLHMLLPWHRSDHKQLPGEDAIRDAIRAQNVPKGAYFFPRATSMKHMSTPEMQEKYKEGPVGHITIMDNGSPAMGKSLMLWFLFSVVIGVFAGYVTGMFNGPGAEYGAIQRAVGTIAILGYCAPFALDPVWKAQPWGVTFKHFIDGVIYALLTAGTFGWLWPGAPA